MLQKILQHKTQLTLFFILSLFLLAIRRYESVLFYDPFLEYYTLDYHKLPLPTMNHFLFVVNLFFRYGLNSIISLLIIFALFKDKEGIKFIALLYVLFFIGLLIAFYFVWFLIEDHQKMTLFYIRRFLIQPLFLLLFIPAFYVQRIKK